tara:strand:+ start:8478 stop:9773 length:1296 start_codon:yes stop_codon:yes gene_type:complete
MLVDHLRGQGTEADEDESNAAEGMRTVRAGFIQLIDCALLLVAAEKGFARNQNINLELSREASWANIRDKLNLGHFDCAHLLAGMAVASQLKVGNPMVSVIAPMSLGLNGNAITVSTALWEKMAGLGGLSGSEGPKEMGAVLAQVVANRNLAGEAPLSFGMVYPYSSHNYELRYWLAEAGIHPDRDVRLSVVPPSYMPDCLDSGHLDGFCVGEPWNSLSVAAGIGWVIVPTSALWRASPEKVLGVRTEWAESHPDALDGLIRALKAAATWAGNADNRDELAQLLARPNALNLPADLIRKILAGEILRPGGLDFTAVEDYIVFDKGAATFPWRSQALWFYSQMVRWGQVEPSAEGEEASAGSYRPDIYRRALAGTGTTMPSANAKVEGALVEATAVGSNSGRLYLGPDIFFDGRRFDPDAIEAYIAGFDIHS